MHLLYIAFIFQKACTSLQKLQDHNFYSSRLFLNSLFRICLSGIYFYLHSISLAPSENSVLKPCLKSNSSLAL